MKTKRIPATIETISQHPEIKHFYGDKEIYALLRDSVDGVYGILFMDATIEYSSIGYIAAEIEVISEPYNPELHPLDNWTVANNITGTQVVQCTKYVDVYSIVKGSVKEGYCHDFYTQVLCSTYYSASVR